MARCQRPIRSGKVNMRMDNPVAEMPMKIENVRSFNSVQMNAVEIAKRVKEKPVLLAKTLCH